MKEKRNLKRLLAAFLVFALAFTVPMPRSAAAGEYSKKDMFAGAASIKGIQEAARRTANYYKDDWGIDVGELNHSLINVYIDDYILPPEHPNAKWCHEYQFEGDTFYFADVQEWDWTVKNCNQNNMSVSVVFMVKWNDDKGNICIDEANREAGHNSYAPATEGYGGKAVRAFWHFVMETLTRDGRHIDNFILGNEVNMPGIWHYSGTSDAEPVVSKYAQTFYDMWSTVREYTSVSRCSVSLDHTWNWVDEGGNGFGGRKFLELFDAKLKALNGGRSVDWCLSTHPYPMFLYHPDIWNVHYNFDGTTDDENTPFIDGSNLHVMTNYVREKFGEEHRIMLTETGFTKGAGEAVQAAALAYTYYAAMYDPMVDSFMLHYHNEGSVSTNEGTFSMDFTFYPLAEEVYKRIDSGSEEDARWIAERCLPTIGVSSWEEIIPNFGGEVNRGKNGFFIEDGVGKLYKNDNIDTSYSGWYTYEGKTYLLKEGVEQPVPSNPGDKNYTGWYKEGDSLRWSDNGVPARNKEAYDTVTNRSYYFDGSGNMVRGYYEEPVEGQKFGRLHKSNTETGAYEGLVNGEWYHTDGGEYWYENGVRQGLEGRGKEIYDPASDAWYWLDSDADGKKAVSKDTYQESEAGPWAEKEDGTGKWVRYDENGHMIKGEHWKDGGWYFFDYTYGTMAKGLVQRDDKTYFYDTDTGRMRYGDIEIDGQTKYFDAATGALADLAWVIIDGNEYWYEDGVRQGLEGRGKEIYDPATNAWYWLDSDANGKKAVSKDVYQESEAGPWAEKEDGTGKWVRYDENGFMIKGWHYTDNGDYYFDPVYGTMAKGTVVIDGETYTFDKATGVRQ